MKKWTFLGVAIYLLVLGAATPSAEALTLQEKVGGLIYRDTSLSLNFNQSCMTCHHPSAGFADPDNRMDPVNLPVSDGSDPTKFGGRNAPSAGYAGFSPILNKVDGVWKGGMFWDGRATGDTLGDPLAEQALGPFQNPVEMAITKAEVVARVAAAPYAFLFQQAYTNTDFSNVDETYNNIGRAIAAFERSNTVTKFTSKFDKFWRACQAAGIVVSQINRTTELSTLPQGILTTRQLQGLALFNDKGKCSACHTTSNHVDPATNTVYPPLFTDFTYDNLGLPTNQRVYDLAGGSPPDLGLGGFLKDPAENGKFKVPTLRNVAKSPPYGHNGYFATLADIVHFYNTRDLGGWPDSEYPDTMNKTELGDLKLSPAEEWSIVVFMQSLTDGAM
jgi:cytochrome c peroxidase